MKIKIETHRDHEIFYDDDTDKFVCDISINGSVKRHSLKALRKEIDNHVKLNVNFKPFKVFLRKVYSSIYEPSFKIVSVVAIRSDGQFIVEEEHLHSVTIYPFVELKSKAYAYDTAIVEAVDKLHKEQSDFMEVLSGKYTEINKKLVPMDLSQYEIPQL